MQGSLSQGCLERPRNSQCLYDAKQPSTVLTSHVTMVCAGSSKVSEGTLEQADHAGVAGGRVQQSVWPPAGSALCLLPGIHSLGSHRGLDVP